LQPLDGRLAGAIYREIAIPLVGEARVAVNWSDPRNHLFDHARRAVWRGRTLMNGGYRRFKGGTATGHPLFDPMVGASKITRRPCRERPLPRL